VLAQRQARTATAEGHEKPGRTPSRPVGEPTPESDAEAPGSRTEPEAEGVTPGSGAPATDAAPREPATPGAVALDVPAAAVTPVPVPDVLPGRSQPVVAPGVVAPAATSAPAASSGEAALAPAGLAPAVLAALAGAAVVAPADHAAAAPSAAAATLRATAPAAAVGEPVRSQEQLAPIGAPPGLAKGDGATSAAGVERLVADVPARDAMPEAPVRPGADPVAAPAAEAARTPTRGADRPAELAPAPSAPAASPPVAAAPAVSAPAPASPAAPAPASPGVRLGHAAEAVENVIRIASSRGVTHARMALAPAELGGIEIRLRSTAAGLSAEVVADSSEAAQVLQVAVPELRRSLEAQGLNLLSLDIAPSDRERDPAASSGEGSARGDGSGGSSSGTGADTDGEPLPDQAIKLPDGVLVDVLA